MSKALTEDMKREIANLCNSTDLSYGAIADKLGVSLRSVHRYKDYLNENPTESKFNNNENMVACPSCGSVKSNWVTVDEMINQNLGTIPDGYQKIDFDYFCLECRELITK